MKRVFTLILLAILQMGCDQSKSCLDGTVWDAALGGCVPSFRSCGEPVRYQGYDYATVLIGEQCWFAENLRNESYNNGDAIPANLSDREWKYATAGAVAVYG